MSAQTNKKSLAFSNLTKKLPLVFGIFCLSILFLNCTQQTKKDPELKMEVLFEKEIEAHCQLSFLKEKITKVWNNIAQLLEENLPETMPKEEKANMIAVRNANLIRMFQSYEELDDSIKEAIERADSIDLEIMKAINTQKEILDEIEEEKIRLMENLAPEARQAYSQKLTFLKNEPCKIITPD